MDFGQNPPLEKPCLSLATLIVWSNIFECGTCGCKVTHAYMNLFGLQAFSDEEHEEEEEGGTDLHALRGLTALAGVYLFFNAERLLGIFTMKKNKKNQVSQFTRLILLSHVLYISYCISVKLISHIFLFTCKHHSCISLTKRRIEVEKAM